MLKATLKTTTATTNLSLSNGWGNAKSLPLWYHIFRVAPEGTTPDTRARRNQEEGLFGDSSRGHARRDSSSGGGALCSIDTVYCHLFNGEWSIFSPLRRFFKGITSHTTKCTGCLLFCPTLFSCHSNHRDVKQVALPHLPHDMLLT